MGNCRDYLEDPAEGIRVKGFLHSAADADADGLVLTHGAGANCDSLLLRSLANAMCAGGLTVLRCDLPFRQARPHGPPHGNADRDREGLRAAVEAVQKLARCRAFLGGHSYGGRQASMLAAEQPGLVDCLLLLSYPLHPPQRPGELRTSHFANLKTPTLFVHGTRDGFGSIAEMEAALALIAAPTELMRIEGAGHELMTNSNREAVTDAIAKKALAFFGR